MSVGGGSDVKKKKVFYDEYSGSFYTESKMEALQRQSDYRSKMEGVLNRSEAARLKVKHNTVKAAQHIFDMKNDRERTTFQENLKDHQAYKQVLENIVKERSKDQDWDDKYGIYGPGVSRQELDSEVQKQLHEMSPMVRRKRAAEFLLSQRKRVEVFDRKKKTPELLEKVHKKRMEQLEKEKEVEEAPRKTPKLILPPITVTLRKEDTRSSIEVTNDVSLLPTVFVTQRSNV